MTKLEIFNPDSSLYWTEHFNSFEQGKEWLLEEKTRPYWNKDFTFTLVDSEQPWLSLQVRLEEVVEEFPSLEPRFIEHLDTIEDAALKAQVLAEREAQAQAQAVLAQQQALLDLIEQREKAGQVIVRKFKLRNTLAPISIADTQKLFESPLVVKLLNQLNEGSLDTALDTLATLRADTEAMAFLATIAAPVIDDAYLQTVVDDIQAVIQG